MTDKIIREILLEEHDRQADYRKVLEVIRSVKTKEQYFTALNYANQYVQRYNTNSKNSDWQTINKVLTLTKIKVRLK